MSQSNIPLKKFPVEIVHLLLIRFIFHSLGQMCLTEASNKISINGSTRFIKVNQKEVLQIVWNGQGPLNSIRTVRELTKSWAGLDFSALVVLPWSVNCAWTFFLIELENNGSARSMSVCYSVIDPQNLALTSPPKKPKAKKPPGTALQLVPFVVFSGVHYLLVQLPD